MYFTKNPDHAISNRQCGKIIGIILWPLNEASVLQAIEDQQFLKRLLLSQVNHSVWLLKLPQYYFFESYLCFLVYSGQSTYLVDELEHILIDTFHTLSINYFWLFCRLGLIYFEPVELISKWISLSSLYLTLDKGLWNNFSDGLFGLQGPLSSLI